MSPELLAEQLALWLPNAFVALVLVLVFIGVDRSLGHGLRFVMTRAKVDRTATRFIESVCRYAVLTVAVISILGQLGVDVTGIVASLGVVGLTVGFAARDALSNVISGVFIFWDRPFVLGDLVEIDGHYGEVAEITMRSTRIVTPDGRMLAIPNATIVNTTVASYTNFPHLRLDLAFTIGVGEDIARVRGLLLDVVADDPTCMDDPPPVVLLTATGDYNNTVELRGWLRDEKTHVACRAALRERGYVALFDAGVDMPVETLALSPVEVRRSA